MRQFEAFKKIVDRDYSLIEDLPRLIQPIELTGKGVARAGAGVYRAKKKMGYVTSGTMVPYWQTEGVGLSSIQSEDRKMRAIGLAMMDSNLVEGDEIEIDIRGKRVAAVIVPYLIRNEAPPYCWPIKSDQQREGKKTICAGKQMTDNVRALIEKAAANTRWRQEQCINLIPSEQTASSHGSTADPSRIRRHVMPSTNRLRRLRKRMFFTTRARISFVKSNICSRAKCKSICNAPKLKRG